MEVKFRDVSQNTIVDHGQKPVEHRPPVRDNWGREFGDPQFGCEPEGSKPVVTIGEMKEAIPEEEKEDDTKPVAVSPKEPEGEGWK